MGAIFVFSQNLKLEYFKSNVNLSKNTDTSVFLTTQLLFENEKDYLKEIFGECVFSTFADYLTDEEMAVCDGEAYTSKEIPYQDYLDNIKRLKNRIVISKIVRQYPTYSRYIISDDLGIDGDEWVKNGFKRLRGEYYYNESKNILNKARDIGAGIPILKRIYHIFRKPNSSNLFLQEEVRAGFYKGRKYVFIGKMGRISYRLDIPFEESKTDCDNLNASIFETKETCTYMTTWHEHGKCLIPDEDKYDVRWAQDGYLPPNYTQYDYHFKPKNVVYYCWDVLGTQLFKNRDLPYEMIPFRKKLYLPKPKFPEKIKRVLIVASGSGDWTALKNRSDDDSLVVAFVEMARRFPEIHFTYRCHPTWVHPLNVGVNAINRVGEYFKSVSLPNLTLSGNTPMTNKENGYCLTFSRNSLEEDLKNTDMVFGEHSISMIDAGLEGIPFCSVNMTKRRNFFVGINDLGFPLCIGLDDIENVINSVSDHDFQVRYLDAVKAFNDMTDIEDPLD